MRAEQQHPTATSNPPRRWPGRGDGPSGAEQSTPADEAEAKRAEQPIPFGSDDYLDVTGGWNPDKSSEGSPRNYEELRERFPDLPVRRPNEARRFA